MKQPFDVYRMEDFTEPQIERAGEEPGKYSAALVFSTKYDPPRPLLTLGEKSAELDEKYFGLHHDLPPEQIAQATGRGTGLGGEDQGQWVALIRFERVLAARAEMPDRVR